MFTIKSYSLIYAYSALWIISLLSTCKLLYSTDALTDLLLLNSQLTILQGYSPPLVTTHIPLWNQPIPTMKATFQALNAKMTEICMQQGEHKANSRTYIPYKTATTLATLLQNTLCGSNEEDKNALIELMERWTFIYQALQAQDKSPLVEYNWQQMKTLYVKVNVSKEQPAAYLVAYFIISIPENIEVYTSTYAHTTKPLRSVVLEILQNSLIGYGNKKKVFIPLILDQSGNQIGSENFFQQCPYFYHQIATAEEWP